MRIAVSGTHASGKSTLIADFVEAHPQFVMIAEPYEFLDSGTEGADAASFVRQGTKSVELLADPTVDGDAIFERAPLDFVAYLAALSSLGRPAPSPDSMSAMLAGAVRSLRSIDLLAVVMLDGHLDVSVDEEEDDELRTAMNDHLLDLLDEVMDEVSVVEIAGSRDSRVRQLAVAYERARAS